MTDENYLKNLADMQTQIKELVPDSLKENGERRMSKHTDEVWYRYCMICQYAYRRVDDADTIYCDVPTCVCPHKEEIEDAERKEE